MDDLNKKFRKLELESYKDAVYDSATEEWNMQYDPKAVEYEKERAKRISLLHGKVQRAFLFLYIVYTPLLSTALQQNRRRIYSTTETNRFALSSVDKLVNGLRTWQNVAWGDDILCVINSFKASEIH